MRDVGEMKSSGYFVTAGDYCYTMVLAPEQAVSLFLAVCDN